MNKKLFGTLLLGSLLLGGTFVSCKDYDDDIENLQEQINNLATKSDVETKLGQLQSALTAAQQKAEEALAVAKAADNTAEVKAFSEKLDKIVLESKFNTVLLAKCVDGEYVFETQSNFSSAKSPCGSLEPIEPNDMAEILKKLEEY